MEDTARINASTRAVLEDLIGKRIVDLTLPETGREEDATAAQAVAIGILPEDGRQVFFSLRPVDFPTRVEGFVLEASTVMTLRRWPHGPPVDWRSASRLKARVEGALVEATTPVFSAYGPGRCAEDGLDISLTGDTAVRIRASDSPQWMEVSVQGTAAGQRVP